MATSRPSPLYDITAMSISGEPVELSRYRGSVLLIVNVASRCGYTRQYEGLEALYRRHREAGLVVLGFPCNQFGHQEPGSEAEIASFCSLTYDVTFPLFAKVDVNGASAHPLYQWLTSEKRGLFGASIKWNFTKFLVGRAGDVIARYGPADTPESLESAVQAALQASA